MIWLQSLERYDYLAAYDHEELRYQRYTRVAMGDAAPREICGMYSFLSGTFFAFYQFKKRLYLCIENQKFPFDDHLDIELIEENDTAEITIRVNNKTVKSIIYIPDYSAMFSEDISPFMTDEEEDFNFGLLLFNISKNKARKRVLRFGE